MNTRNQLILFFLASACVAAGSGIYDSIFNNFLADTFSLSAMARGWLELPRETPGFLVFLTAGIFATLALNRLGVVAALMFAAGLAGLALFGERWTPMMAMLLLSSTGMHLLQPVQGSISIALSEDGNRGRRLGQVGAFSTVGSILGTAFVWLTFHRDEPQYAMGFAVAAMVVFATAGLLWTMRLPQRPRPKARIVFRRKFWLYYVLELLFGARKQVFITFGPWVLVQVYGASPGSIAKLLLIASVIGIVFKPLAGVAIDRFGERAVLVADGILLAVVCAGYGYAFPLCGGDHEWAYLLAAACFVADNLLFALCTARTVYVSRHTSSPEELTSTLAMGVSINHIVSMTIPMVAGAIWIRFGYERVFLSAAGLALVTMAFASLLPRKGDR